MPTHCRHAENGLKPTATEECRACVSCRAVLPFVMREAPSLNAACPLTLQAVGRCDSNDR
eukprot:10040042-Alexandrium_andersonii.AAC.1